MPQKDQIKMLQAASIGEKAKDNNFLGWDTENHVQYGSIYLKGEWMYDASKTQVNTRVRDMHMKTVIVGCLLFKNINPTRMRGMEKQTAAIQYVRMKVLIIYKEDDCWGHKLVIDNDPKLI